MKKFYFTLTLTFILTASLQAQQPRFGFNAGILSSKAKITADNQSTTSKSRIGFNAGVMVDVPLGSNFSFQPGLSFLQKGGKEDENDGTDVIKSSISINYLELPLNLIYKAKGKSGSFNLGAGPCLSYGLSGKAKATFNGISASQKLNFGSSANDDLKRFEFGGNILAGYELTNGLSFTLNYNIGFSNVAADPQSKWKNYYGGLRIGFLLPHKKK